MGTVLNLTNAFGINRKGTVSKRDSPFLIKPDELNRIS